MGQLFNRLKNFAKVTAADLSGDLDRATRIIDADDDELRRIIDELNSEQPAGARHAAPSEQRTAIPHEVLTAARVLGVRPTATADEVKKAYRVRIAAVHPDKVAQRPLDEQRRAEQEAKAVNAAYETMQRYLGIA
jgi:DnaJ-domain-containing protein 1